MASNDNNDSSNASKGNTSSPSGNRNAAAEEEEENTAAAAEGSPPPYDPRQFQKPHPDDIDGGSTGKGKNKTKAKAGKDTSGKAAADGSHCCYHCGTAGAKSCCGGCHRAW